MDVTIRDLSHADAEGLADLIALARGDGGLAASSRPHAPSLAEDLVREPDLVKVAAVGDRIVGFVELDNKVVYVAPDQRRRGIGRRLVDGLVELAIRHHRMEAILGCLPGNENAIGFLRATGFAPHSMLWDLELPTGRAAPRPTWPPGAVPRSVDPQRDVAAYVALWNDAFADHPTPLLADEPRMAGFWATPEFDPADVLVVEEPGTPGRLVGLCEAIPTRDGDRIERGEVEFVGVAADRRGQGLGRSLLRWGIEHLRSSGAGPIDLSVNGRNERALGLWEREGFERRSTRDRWSRPVSQTPGA